MTDLERMNHYKDLWPHIHANIAEGYLRHLQRVEALLSNLTKINANHEVLRRALPEEMADLRMYADLNELSSNFRKNLE